MNNSLKSALICLLVIFCQIPITAIQGQTKAKKLKKFDKIVVSPKIELELVEGQEESIRLEYFDVEEHKVNVVVRNKTLRIYLDNAKYIVKNKKGYNYRDGNGRWDNKMYRDNVQVKAYVTYKTLKRLQVRGAEDIDIKSTLKSQRFKLKLYGESVVNISSLETKKFKAVLIGENRLNIRQGKAQKQKYKSIGENWVRADDLDSNTARASLIGEGRVKLKVDDHLRIFTIGESEIVFEGNPVVRKRFIIGHAEIRRGW